jgi:hypothetical protein
MKFKVSVLSAAILFISFISHSQVYSPEFAISEEIKKEYPFLEGKFYSIVAEDDLGYFVIMFNKAQFGKFVLKQTTSLVTSLLDKYGFYNNNCYYQERVCGYKKREIGGQRLSNNSFSAHNNNYNSLQLNFGYKLNGRIRERIKKCFETEHDNYNKELASIKATTNLFYYYIGRSTFLLRSRSSATLAINFSGCNRYNSPYRSRATYYPTFSQPDERLDFSKLGDFFAAYVSGTKKVKIIEDEKYIYLYCIK